MFQFIKKLWRFKSIFPPLREVLSEDGVGSYSRYTGFMLVLATIFWITYLVIRTHVLPDLEGPALFIGASQSSYGLNQIKNVAAAARSIKQINQGDSATVIQVPMQNVSSTPVVDGGNDAAKS
jgi:hypothetical protein